MNTPPANLIDGTMVYIPFTNDTLITPTFVSNITYTNATGLQTLGPVLQGDIVSVSFGRVSGGSTIMARRINRFFSSDPSTSIDVLMGSLVTIGGAVNNTLIDQPFDTIERVGVGRTVGSFMASASTTIIPQRAFPTSVIPGSSTLILNSLSLPAITTLPEPRATALSIDNPNFITITILVMGGTQMICSTVMTVALTNETTSILDNLPFNMPVPGALLSRESAPGEGRGYFIQSIATSVNADHENFRIGPGSIQIAPFLTFPRITDIWNQVSFGVVLQTTNRAINIQNNNDIICQLGVVYVN
jgi:hypothetical protein